MSIATLKTQLTAIEDKITEIYKTGQEYTITGSHSVKNPRLQELEQQRARVVRRLLARQGYFNRIQSDFS